MEVTMNETVSRKKILSLARGLEMLHLAFPAPYRPMRVLRTIVEISA